VREKVGRAALAYDPSTDRGSLQAFDGRPLMKSELKDQLKSCFNGVCAHKILCAGSVVCVGLLQGVVCRVFSPVVVSHEELDALVQMIRTQQPRETRPLSRGTGASERTSEYAKHHEEAFVNGTLEYSPHNHKLRWDAR
jgi:hypothetical protein